jgi:DNA polymerase-1
MTSTDPNLQKYYGPKQPRQGNPQGFCGGKAYWLILSADYSQIELRIVAHISGDNGLIEALKTTWTYIRQRLPRSLPAG